MLRRLKVLPPPAGDKLKRIKHKLIKTPKFDQVGRTQTRGLMSIKKKKISIHDGGVGVRAGSAVKFPAVFRAFWVKMMVLPHYAQPGAPDRI